MKRAYRFIRLVNRRLTSNSSSKAQNRACKLRTISSNIIHHLEGRSELRDALTCELGFKVKVYKET